MKRIALFALSLLLSLTAFAQAHPSAPAGRPTAGPIDVQFANTLIQLQQAVQDANVALGRLRIDKWKTDGAQKQQAQANVESLQRNLSAAFPELLQKVRENPQDLSVNFKLYRNLSAVYDVLASVTEASGAFGPKDQYQALGQPVSVMDAVRRSLADRMESLAASKEAELARLRAAAATAAPAQAATTGVKKIVVDDNAPTPKSKKTKPKPKASTEKPPQ
jgi:hypothetical protein